MRRGAIISALVHFTVIVIAFFGLPTLFRPDPAPVQPIAVDVVMVEPKPVVPTVKPEPPKPKPEIEHKAKPRPARIVPPPPPPMAALPEPVPAPKPKLKPKPKPKPKARPKPKPKPPVRTAKRVPRPKKKPKPPPDRFQTLLKNLAKQSHREREKQKRKPEPAKKTVQVAVAPQPSAVELRRLAAGLAQLVEQQIRECWNIPVGAKDVAEMRIEIRIQLNPDGTLRGQPRVGDARRMQSDHVFRAVAESAVRALRKPRCSPLKLPFTQYDIWKEITLNFDPRKALGQ